MNYSTLLEEALDQRGNAILVLSRPGDGADAVIHTANSCFARIILRQADLLTGLRFEDLRSVVELEEDWQVMINAMRTLTPLKLDMRLRVGAHQVWLGFELAFKSDTQERASYGILIGRDITDSRRRKLQDNESQRLLASVFLRTSAPVVIVRSDGVILMSNPAFQRLIGYTAREITSLNVASLTSPKYAEVAQRARNQQFQDGERFELHLETITKNGSHVPVLMTSVLLRDTQDLRVVTLLPYLADPGSPLTITPDSTSQLPATRNIGQVHAVSLAALRPLFGESWQHVALRAMMLAEQVIKRRLAPRDVFVRTDDGFMIWFDSQDEDRNAALLEKTVREIRRRFLEEFGNDKAATICAHVTSAMVKATAETSSPEAFNKHCQSADPADKSRENNKRMLKFAGTLPTVPQPPERDAAAKATLIKSAKTWWRNGV